MSYIFWGFLFGVLIPYMARRFAKFMPATAAYALYRLLWPVKTVSDERKRANPAYQKLMSAYVMRSLGYGIIMPLTGSSERRIFGGIWRLSGFCCC